MQVAGGVRWFLTIMGTLKGGHSLNLFIKQAGMAPQQGANFKKFEKKKAWFERDSNWDLLGEVWRL